MNEERLRELLAAHAAGDATLEDIQREMDASIATEFNDPPTPLHVWNGKKWLLPAEHEVKMLDVMLKEGTIEEDAHAEALERAQAQLDEQRGLAEEVAG